jgi:predicted aspartyl protease
MLPFHASAQSADSLAGAYMNGSRWFKLYDLYEVDSAKISPFLRDFSRVMLSQFFNQPRRAISDINRLLRQHQEEMGFGNVVSMVCLMAEDYYKLNQTDSAATTLQSFIKQVDGKVDSAAWAYPQRLYNIFSALAPYKLYETDPKASYVLPFYWDQVGDDGQYLMKMKGSFNGQPETFCFDTGASYNVISQELAEQLQLKPIAHGLPVEGTARGEGDIVVAESIKIGNMTLRHVPFVTLDMAKGNELAGKTMSDLGVIIGVKLMNRFAKYSIDMEKHTVTFFRDTQKTNETPNLCMPSVLSVRANKGGKTLDLKLDLGKTRTELGNNYYKEFNSEVMREGKWSVEGGAGYGGVRYHSVFKLPKLSLSIDSNEFTLEDVSVIAMSDKENIFGKGYGTLGNDFLRKWQKVEIDNVNMTIHLQPKKEKK